MKKFQALLCVVLLGALASTAAASSNADSKLDLRIAFDGQRNLILSALQDGETYSEIKPEDKRQVRASLDRIADLLAGSATADSLSEADGPVPSYLELIRYDARTIVRALTGGAG